MRAQRFLLVVAALLVTACGASESVTPATTVAPATTTTNPRWAMDYRALSTAELSPGELAFEQSTKLAYGMGTNPPKMLEFGYDLCERYARGGTRAQAIRDWATENNEPLARAQELGAAATRNLCPE